MFKHTMKSFFKSMRFIVIPMAFIYFGVLALAILLIEGIIKAIAIFGAALNSVIKTTGQAISLNINKFMDYISNTKSFDVNNTKGFFDGLIANLKLDDQGSIQKLSDAGVNAGKTLLVYVLIGAIILIVGLLLSFIITGIVIRKDSGMKSNFGKYLLRLLFRVILLAGLIFATWGINKLSKWWAIPLTIGYFIIDVFLSFFTSFILHKKKGNKGFFKTLRFRDILVYILTNLLLVIITLGIVALLMLLIQDLILAVVVMIPILVLICEFFSNQVEIFVMKRIHIVNGVPIDPKEQLPGEVAGEQPKETVKAKKAK